MPSSPVERNSPKVSRPSLWRNHNFLLLWSGQGISSIGSQLSQLAFPLFILAITGSPAQAGFAAALRALPYLFLSLPAGALNDRWNRKRVMIICDIGRAIALGSIPIAFIFGYLTVVQLYIVSLIEGSLYVFFNIAEAACLPNIVAKEQLPAATAQNEAMVTLSSLLGPSLGGLLYSMGKLLPFVVDAISYAVSVLSLLLIRAHFQQSRSSGSRSLQVEIREGITWLWRQPLLRFMAVTTSGLIFVNAATPLFVIVLAQRQHASSFVIGIIFAAGGVGGILGSMIGGWIQKRFRFGQVIAGTIWIQALLWPLYIFAPSPLWLALITAGTSLVSPIYNIVQFSYRLALIPDNLQGRVNSVFRLVAWGSEPIGVAIAGLLLQTIGPTYSLLLFFLPQLALSVVTTLNRQVQGAKPLADI